MGLIADLVMDQVRSNREEKQAAQYGALLGEYRQPAAPGTIDQTMQYGPVPTQQQNQAVQAEQGGYRQGPSGVLGSAPPSEFFMRAAAIPGYQQLAAGAQSNVGAMERQQAQFAQQNIWRSELSLPEKVAAEANAVEAERSQTRWQMSFDETKAMNAAQLRQQAIANAQAAQGQAIQGATFNANYLPDPNRPGQYMPRPAAPAPLSFADQTKVQQVHGSVGSALSFLDDVERIGAPYFATGRGGAMRDEAQVKLRNVAMQVFQPGGGEPSPDVQKKIDAFIGDPTDWQSPERRAAKVELMRQELGKQWAPYSGLMQAPVATPGSSAFARTYQAASKLPSDVSPWKPISGR